MLLLSFTALQIYRSVTSGSYVFEREDVSDSENQHRAIRHQGNKHSTSFQYSKVHIPSTPQREDCRAGKKCSQRRRPVRVGRESPSAVIIYAFF